jgi:hypothetical protein
VPACFVRDRTDVKKITTRNKLQRPSDIIASNGWQNKPVGQAVDGYFHKTGVIEQMGSDPLFVWRKKKEL